MPIGSYNLQGFGSHLNERPDIPRQNVSTAVKAGNHDTSVLFDGISAVNLPNILLIARQALMSLMANCLGSVVEQDLGLDFLLKGFEPQRQRLWHR